MGRPDVKCARFTTSDGFAVIAENDWSDRFALTTLMKIRSVASVGARSQSGHAAFVQVITTSGEGVRG